VQGIASDPDEALMLRLKEGNDHALNELMRRWQTPLVNFIFRYVGAYSDALDLAQETFVRIYESRERYRPSASFSTWLFAIAANLSRNLLRWRERHPSSSNQHTRDERGEDAAAESESATDSPTPADNAAWNDLASAVREHVAALPDELKTVVLLYEYEYLSQSEIAAVLGCSAKAVETRLYRARKILRKTLERWHIN